mgnify:CR=1 FL=1
MVSRVTADHVPDETPLSLAAVGCSGSKFEDAGTCPAKNLYKGSYWVNKKKYGEACADEWRIISAEHALLHPNTEITYYERTPADLEDIPVDTIAQLPSGAPVDDKLDAWALDVYNGLETWLTTLSEDTSNRPVRLDILLGRSYRAPLESRDVFTALEEDRKLTIRFPFQEIEAAQGGLFQQIKWMGNAVDAAASPTNSP